MRRSRNHIVNAWRHAAALPLIAVMLTVANSHAAPLPDLVVTDFWNDGGTVRFTLKNSGTAIAAAGQTAYLSVDGHDKDTAYVAAAVSPGKTYAGSFAKYSWECVADGQHTLVVRADGTNKVAESNEKNNALSKVWTCDVTAPEITQGPLVLYITTTSAKVSWTTDESSDGTVRYGQVSGQYSDSRSSSILTTDHKILLDNLRPDTLYYFVVESADQAGHTVQCEERTFRTQSERPQQPDLLIADLWEDDHLIHFRVRNAGDASADAGHRAGLYIADRLIDTARIAQALAPGESLEMHFEKFYFQCFDAEHKLRIIADIDDIIAEADENNNLLDKTLTCDVTPLTITSCPVIQVTGTTSATVAWGTNKPADSEVLYDARAGLFGQHAEDETPTVKHRVTLDKLTPGTAYQFKVRSTDASGQSVTSRTGYFQTLAKPDTVPPKVLNVKIDRRDTKYPSYRMEATATDDQGVEKVQFLVDGTVIGTDYAAPYDAVFAPGMISQARAEFFRPHPVEAIAWDNGRVQGTWSGLFNPPYECNEINADFQWPAPREKIYIPGETAPPGTEVPIQVRAAMMDMTCWDVAGVEGPPGRSMGTMVCDTDEVAVRKVTFSVNGASIGVVASQADHIYTTTWDANGFPLGTHVIRADITGGDECIQTITQEVEIVRGDMELDLTRRVWREDNAFRIRLTVHNHGTLDYACALIQDNVAGLQPIADTRGHYEITTVASADGRQSDVSIALSEDGLGAQTIHAGTSLNVEYYAIPIQFPGPAAATYSIGAEDVLITDMAALNPYAFARPCVVTEDGVRLASEIESAMESSDYLIVTNPQNCRTEFGAADDVLVQMARLAYHRNGILGCVSGTGSDDPAWVLDQICAWGPAMASGYLSNGYLLLVGETEILPGWDIDISPIDWTGSSPTSEVPCSDLPYGDVSGSDNVPELRVGRIIGNDAGDLIQAMEASLAGGFDRSFGVATSGIEGVVENFVDDARHIHDVWVGQAASGGCMTDEQMAHHWTAYIHKEEPVSGYDFPMSAGEGFVVAAVGGNPLAAMRIDPASDAAHGATHGDLDLVHSSFSLDLDCAFHAGDALAAGDIDGDGEDEIVVGSVGTDQILVACDPPHTAPGKHPFLSVTLAPGDAITCGRPGGAIVEQILVASAAGGGSVRVYEYDPSVTPALTLTETIDVPFSSGDAFAAGDVNATGAGDEIIIGRAGENRIDIYDADGNVVAQLPCEAFTANDGLVAGDLDDDGEDEIAGVVDDAVGGKRRLLMFQNDCWTLNDDGTWEIDSARGFTVYSRFLHFDGARTTGGSGRDGIACRDINGDGKEEICIARESDDRLYVLDGHYPWGWKDRYMPVVQDVDDRIDIFTLNGHGSRVDCAPFSMDDIDTLSLDAHPLVFAFSCNTGCYEGVPDDGFAEKFFKQGAAVYIGATTLSSGPHDEVASPGFFSAWECGQTAGAAFAAYRRGRAADDDAVWRFWALEFNYYGDPKFGGSDVSDAAAHAALAVAAEPDLPGLNEPVTIPAYEVTPVDGKDRVTLPGGDVLIENARPVVPCWKVQWELPAGTVVQDVRLRQRTGLQSGIGLILPITTLSTDGGDVQPTAETAAAPSWYPAKDLDWWLVPNADGSITLAVSLYPFFYNSLTTESRFYPKFLLDVEITTPDLRIASLFTDRPVYKPGDTVTVNLLVNGGGKAQDVIVDTAIRKYGSNELVAGLLLRRLGNLIGPASFSPGWTSRDAAPGIYYADVTLATPGTTTVLARARYLFQLETPPDKTTP